MEMEQPVSNKQARLLIKASFMGAPVLRFELEALAQMDKVSLEMGCKDSERQSGSSESVERVTVGVELIRCL